MPKAARPRKCRNGWRVRWLDATGVRKSRMFKKYDDAERFLRQQQVSAERIKAGLEVAPPDPHTFADLCEYWIKHETPRKRSPKDDNSIINAHLKPFFGHIELTLLGAQHVDAYRQRCRNLPPPEKGRRKTKGISDKTVHNHLTLLIALLNKAVELGWLYDVPRIRKPKLVQQDYRWLRTTKEIKALLEAAQKEYPGVMELYAAAIYTGMRAGELLGLRWEDVDLDSRLITVRRSYGKPTKTGAIRHVPVLDPLLPVLRAWREQNPLEWVFPGQTGRRQGPSARVLQEILHRCREKAKLEGEQGRITFHDLRHTFASHWVMKGGDLYRLQKVLGHKSPQMTMRYAHLAPEAFREDWGLLNEKKKDESGEGQEADARDSVNEE
jgi:integrase